MSAFVAHVAGLLDALGGVTPRRMFGGHGLFRGDLMFGIVADDVLYLKADGETRADFERRGLPPFGYLRGGRRVELSYYRAPAEVLEDPERAAAWARRACEAALRARAARPSRGRRRGGSGARGRGALELHQRPQIEATRALLGACGLPVEDIDALDLGHFIACGPRRAPHGVVGLEPLGAVALLRSLAVREEMRGRGCGAVLLAAAERHAAARGVGALYLLTTTAEDFFLARGFRRAAREGAPAAVRATREFTSLCPASAAFMVKTLPGPPGDAG